MATFLCRVQFLDDTDPFNSTNFPEPTRPPLYTFREDIPLINQIAGVHRLLKAPQKEGKETRCYSPNTAVCQSPCLHRETLQFNWTGAPESPLFPQADLSG
uniref:Formin homology 2 domain containing 3b n=1 Tax=Gasterosteus aculeatus aculeatus TaxID=481459 RepID=A0AAQ4QBW2_GASAC